MDRKFNCQFNLSLLVDFYEITMGNGFFKNNKKDTIAYFDMFFRAVPDGGGLAIMAGLEQLIEYLQNLSFNDEDISFLRSKNLFDEDFLAYLRDFKFSCDVWAVPEGTPVFPHEPLITIRGPIIEAQFIETMVLLTINHQSLIATKANRIVRAAEGRPVMEFGSRRAQGYDGAIYGARASYIGGCVGTACTIADLAFGAPAMGTMAHSWVQLFDTELEAFHAYAKAYPDNCSLLVDTYNVLKSGMPNAIRTFKEVVVPQGYRPKAVRIDSGDITYLSKEMRRMLDEAGFSDCKIIASNALDEFIIRDLLMQGAAIDSFGVGERLITSKSEPVFGGVYKLSAIEKDGAVIPKVKISENVEKITHPGFKQVYRIFHKETHKAMADVITLHEETINEKEPYTIFHPEFTWKTKTFHDYYVKPLLQPIFEAGTLVYQNPTATEVRAFCMDQLSTLWEEVLRFENPHRYYVDLSPNLWKLKEDLLYAYATQD